MERRRQPNANPILAKSSPLPSDYLKLVSEIFSTNFDSGLKALAKIKPNPRFEASGQIYPDEIVLCISISHEGQLAATSVYASMDFDPKASAPTVQDVLAVEVDAIGSLYEQLLKADDPARLEQLADESLSAMENVPFEWTEFQMDKKKVYLKIDKANPKLDEMADEWLKKNDPDHEARALAEQKETEDLFVTGPKGTERKPGGSSGTMH